LTSESENPGGTEEGHGRYLRAFLGLLFGAALGIVALNWWVDPYGMFRAAPAGLEPAGFNTTLRLSKARAVARIKPQAIILGTSRAELGLDPSHPGWPVAPVYNLALSGGTLYEMSRYLQHAQQTRPLTHVVMSVEFGGFLAKTSTQKGFDETALAVDADGRPTPPNWRRIMLPLFSRDALEASLAALTARAAPKNAILYHSNGQREWRSKLEQVKRSGGYHRDFVKREDIYLRSVQNRRNQLEDAPLASFDRILAFAATHGIHLSIVLDPVHARRLELYDLTGRWPLFEAWKRRLAAMVEARRQAGATIDLWDFTGYSPVTTEPVPPPGDKKTEMAGYWEVSHYKSVVGDRVLDTLFGRTGPDGSSFGVRLTPESLEPHLALIRHEQQAFRTRYPEVAAELAERARRLAKSGKGESKEKPDLNASLD